MGEIDYLQYIKRYTKISKILSLIVILIAVIVLIGWVANIQVLRSFSPGMVNMNPFSAVVFILLGISVILYNINNENKFINTFILFSILLSLLVGIITIINFLFGLGLTYDTVFLAQKIRDVGGDISESRIVPSLSLGLILISASFLLIYLKKSYRLSNVLAFIGLILGWLGILGRLYNVGIAFNSSGLFIPVAFSASLAVFLLSFSILNLAPSEGYVRLIFYDNIAGSTSRILIASSFNITGLLGWIGLDSVNRGVFPNDLGVLYFVVLNSVLFLFLFYYSAIVINREEEKRKVSENLIVLKTFELEKNKINLEKNLKELEDTKTAVLNILEDLEVEKDMVAKEKDKISAILESIGDAVFVVDSDYKINVFNKVSEQLSGYSAEEALGKKYTDILKFIYEDGKKPNEKFIKDSMENGEITSMSNHTLLVNRKGIEIPVSDSAAPLKDNEGSVIGCVVVFRDVTKERDIDKAKTEFVSLASHQLRTPLSAINWYTQMLTDGDAGKVTKQQKEFLDEIANGSRRMVDLVNSLLNVSRIDVGTFAIEPKPTDIVDVSKSLVKEMAVTVKAKELNIIEKYDKIPVTPLDPNLIRIVIQNILSNAIKYSDPKKEIDISISKDDKNINLEIADQGYGIPKAQQGKIFEKLFRADNVRQKDVEGTGLGLYIVKSIVETSGGQIRFVSEENKGTTFYVSIPLTGMKKKEGAKDLSA
ncbi:MAG: ATP-binding protein [Candidatus Dojkabacteria bacterium]